MQHVYRYDQRLAPGGVSSHYRALIIAIPLLASIALGSVFTMEYKSPRGQSTNVTLSSTHGNSGTSQLKPMSTSTSSASGLSALPVIANAPAGQSISTNSASTTPTSSTLIVPAPIQPKAPACTSKALPSNTTKDAKKSAAPKVSSAC